MLLIFPHDVIIMGSRALLDDAPHMLGAGRHHSLLDRGNPNTDSIAASGVMKNRTTEF